jgi:hypothetical protein
MHHFASSAFSPAGGEGTPGALQQETPRQRRAEGRGSVSSPTHGGSFVVAVAWWIQCFIVFSVVPVRISDSMTARAATLTAIGTGSVVFGDPAQLILIENNTKLLIADYQDTPSALTVVPLASPTSAAVFTSSSPISQPLGLIEVPVSPGAARVGYIVTTLNKVVFVHLSGAVTPIAGSPTRATSGNGDGVGSAASFDMPYYLAVVGTAPFEAYLVAGGAQNCIRVLRRGTFGEAAMPQNFKATTGTGTCPTAGKTSGLTSAATFNSPTGVAASSSGGLLFVTEDNGSGGKGDSLRKIVFAPYSLPTVEPWGGTGVVTTVSTTLREGRGVVLSPGSVNGELVVHAAKKDGIDTYSERSGTAPAVSPWVNTTSSWC